MHDCVRKYNECKGISIESRIRIVRIVNIRRTFTIIREINSTRYRRSKNLVYSRNI